MKVFHLDCQRCGAPIEMAAQATRGQCEFCGSQVMRAASPDLAAQAASESASEMRADLEALKQREQIRELDARWRKEREGLKLSRKDGSRARPTKGGAIVVGLMFLGFAIISAFMTSKAESKMSHFETQYFSESAPFTVDADGNLRQGPSGSAPRLGGRVIGNGKRGLTFATFLPLLAAALGLIVGVYHFRKAAAYDRAEAIYRRQRRALMRD